MYDPTPVVQALVESAPARPLRGMLKALRWEILRQVEANGLKKIPMAEKPVRVATLIDEKAFLEDQLMIHNRNVFLEDRIHDWDHRDGEFRYYTRVDTVADVLVVYEVDENYIPPAKFCGETGKPLTKDAAA